MDVQSPHDSREELNEWLTKASKTIESCTAIESVRKGGAWMKVQDDTESFTTVIATLGRECRGWAPGATLKKTVFQAMSSYSLTGPWSEIRNLAGPTLQG